MTDFLSRQERDELRELANAATPGPWYLMQRLGKSYDDHGYRLVAESNRASQPVVYAEAKNMLQHGKGYVWGDDAAFISMANPKTIAALLNHIDALERQVEGAEEALSFINDGDNAPLYNSQAMGCGLEDRNITDRYEAMQYGWDEAMDKIYDRVISAASEYFSAKAAIAGAEGE